MRAPGILILIIATAASIDATVYNVTPATEWWQTTTVYQIWPRSFKDSDGDGVGDLNGIISELKHLADMGIGAVWLSPIYKSPMIDSGYDVSDYRDVNPVYGTLDDFKKLVATAKELGLKVILDFVPNHTSDEHEWFVKSKAGVEPYTDYYVWNEGKLDANGTRQPPNNWLSRLNTGSAWKWVEERQAYYLHRFHEKQADLNLRNSLVLQETKDIMTFWLDYGVSGFRVDAAPFYVEDEKLRDEEESGWPGYDTNDYYYLLHDLIEDQPEDFDIIRGWREFIDIYNEESGDEDNRIMFVEAYSNISNTMKYYEYGAHYPMNHKWLKTGEAFDNLIFSSANDIVDIIDLWMENMPSNYTANWVLGNHDNNRMATKYGDASIDGLHMLLLLLPGVATIWNGDELGMTDTYLTWEQTEDPLACSSDETHYQLISRDPVRTPYQWDNSTSAGFSTNSTTMLPVNPNYLKLNLAAQEAADVSHYKNVKALIELRNNSVIKEGSLDVRVLNESVVAFARKLDGEKWFFILFNWDNETSVECSLEVFGCTADKLEVLVADIYSGIVAGDVVEEENILLPAKAAVVLREI